MGVVNEDTIWIPNGNEYRPYLVHNIYYCEAQNQYTLLYIVDSNGKVNPVLSTKGLGVWEKQLEFHKFCRVHRNVLVNIRHIRKFINGKDGIIVLENEKNIAVSQTQKRKLLSILGIK